MCLILTTACSASRTGPRSEWLPRAIDAGVLLQNEPPLDPDNDKVLIIEIKGTVAELGSANQNGFEKMLVISVSETEQQTLFFKLPRNLNLPLESDQFVHLRYAVKKHPKGAGKVRAVIIQNDKKELLFLHQEGSLIPKNWLPRVLELRAHRSIAYTEAGRLSELCYGVIEHRVLRLGGGLGRQTLQPGERAEVSDGAERFQVIALDHAVTVRSECENFNADRQAWIAVRLPPNPDIE